ncbi:MAG: type II toxin-antitoxin system RelE/ParE family toxin [Gallionellaceae bacterium]|jgi:plasmid stabilization system protein ParE|nr:type II toxin-antitoxin system RelE/ParE family toxin [Gallionellaceae bacterium]
MTYMLHPGAEHDVANALDFYSKHAGTVVAERFLEEFERVAKLLVEHPDLGAPTTRGRRAFPLKVFPYSVVYRNLENNSIRILIVRHQHRKPGYAGGRR